MFHDAEHDRLLSDLRALQGAVRDSPGMPVLADRVDSALGDFEQQPTIWDAREGRHHGQGWALPGDFATLFEAWIAAYRGLADVRQRGLDGLEEALSAVEAASDTLLAELYRCKDPRAGRLALAIDLFEASEEIVRQNLRRLHPDAPPEVIESLVDEWLLHRPGAEAGDGWGRPTTWPRKAS